MPSRPGLHRDHRGEERSTGDAGIPRPPGGQLPAVPGDAGKCLRREENRGSINYSTEPDRVPDRAPGFFCPGGAGVLTSSQL